MASAAKQLFSNFHNNHRQSVSHTFGSRKRSIKGNGTEKETDEQANARREEDRRLICEWESGSKGEVLSEQEITKPADQKQVGRSSKHLKIEDFELVKTLGTGTFARVYLAKLTKPTKDEEGKVFALKILRKIEVIKLKQVEHVNNERKILAAVAGHPFITTLVASFRDHDCLYMIMDFCPGGEIFSYLRRARRFEEKTAKFYAAEICLILQFLHDKEGVAYRDLKPENILLDADGHIKLVDFGFAKQLQGRETWTLCGTPEYLAPETIRNSGHGSAVDWWAFGVLIYEFLVGQPPFWDQNPMRIYEQIVEGHIRFPSSIPSDAKDLISKLCETNPTKRLGNIRGGGHDVRSHPWFKDIDWDKLYRKEIEAPIKPQLKHGADTRNFEDYDESPTRRSNYTLELQKKWDEKFNGF